MRSSLVLAAWLVACGGGKGGVGTSGVDRDQAFQDLDASEIETLCEYLAALAPPPRTVACPTGGDQVVDGFTEAECEAEILEDQARSPDCPITAGEYEDCLEALLLRSDAEVCNDEAFPPACEPLLACI